MTLALFYVHTASVQTYLGNAASGPTYAAAVNVVGFFDDTEKLVVSSKGTEVVAGSSFFTDLANAGLFEPGTLVANTRGNTAPRRVVSMNARDTAGLLSAVEHVEVRLI